MGPPKKDDISREKTILMTSLRTHMASAVSSPGFHYTHPPPPPCAIERSLCTAQAPHHSLADNFFQREIVYIETMLFCFCFAGINFFLFIPISTEQNCVLKPAEGLEGGGWGLLHLMLHQTGKFAKVFRKTFNSMSNKQLYILEAKLISNILGVSPISLLLQQISFILCDPNLLSPPLPPHNRCFLCFAGLKILSSQKIGGFRGVPFEPFRLSTPSLMFFFNT